jgi:uncharacterized surface protein with fasciclin (FAS1) repeats
MTHTRTLLKAALVAAPLGVVGLSAQAADVVQTIQNQQQFPTFAKALKSAGMTDSLQGTGPYTIFAPTDEGFAQLPPGTMNYLMQQGNQAELKKLLQYHVVEGKQLTADQMIGKQAKVATVEGGKLSIDGSGRMVLLVPTGLTVTRVGDQLFVKRDVAALSTPAVEVAPAGQNGQQNGQQAKSGSNGQQQASNSGSGQQPASDSNAGQTYQRPASASDTSADQQGRTDVTQRGNMPATAHQEQVLKGKPPTEQRQTMAQTEGAMPSTQAQRQVLRGQQPGERGGNGQQTAMRESGNETGALREATVVGGPIKADNGVIYAIDGVLVPQSILSQVESHAQQQGQGQMQNNQQGQSQQNKG